MSNLTIVIPAYNEEEALKKALPGILAYCETKNWKIVIVNDGSGDQTKEEVSKYLENDLLTLINHKVNRGYGGAIKSGINSVSTEYVITFDADGQHKLEDVDRLFAYMQSTDADMVVGSRPLSDRNDWYRSAGKWLIRRITNILMPIKVKDLNSGMKLYRSQIAKRLIPLCPNSMAFSDVMTLIFINQGHLVLEHPIEVNSRMGGKSTISYQTAVETVLEIINIVVLFNPLRLFLPLSFIFILLGMAWGIPIVLLGRGVSTGSLLLITIGVMLIFLGLISEQLSKIRQELLRTSHEEKQPRE
jgi:glycosyltransferase involved in cell wall biosynthesis